jgi:hypothetical protein
MKIFLPKAAVMPMLHAESKFRYLISSGQAILKNYLKIKVKNAVAKIILSRIARYPERSKPIQES